MDSRPVTRETRTTVIGAGSWGTTVASLAARNSKTTIWARREELAAAIRTDHVNPDYLPGEALDPSLDATSSLAGAAAEADVLIVAVPSQGLRGVITELAPHLRPWIPIVSLSKGIEHDSLKRMTEVIAEVLPGHPAGVLTGPNIALEIVRGYAAAAVIAMPDTHLADALQGLLRTPRFRIYTSTDVAGAELAGAFKNVYAVASGMAQGLGAGDNTRATLIARSLRELSHLGEAYGGKPETFSGLAGLGDLLATCMSPRSRNRTVGEELAKGRSLEEITESMQMVAEGPRTAPAVLEMAARRGLELPIANEVAAVVRGERTPAEAFRGLQRRDPSSELIPG
jgi:glycerol-3-phosphate dehydrogenase (NAD(P)+)